MRFFLDHDVPVEVARVLRHEGYEVTELREVLAVRATDVEVFKNGFRSGAFDPIQAGLAAVSNREYCAPHTHTSLAARTGI